MFKAGDRVKYKSGTTFSNGDFVNTVEEVVDGVKVYLMETGLWVYIDHIKHETPTASPVRTVTRREIVPGVYAKLTIDTAGPDHVRVATSVNMSAEELREAAHLFNQLAEALEENK